MIICRGHPMNWRYTYSYSTSLPATNIPTFTALKFNPSIHGVKPNRGTQIDYKRLGCSSGSETFRNNPVSITYNSLYINQCNSRKQFQRLNENWFLWLQYPIPTQNEENDGKKKQPDLKRVSGVQQ
jgi:hypothetical protein